MAHGLTNQFTVVLCIEIGRFKSSYDSGLFMKDTWMSWSSGKDSAYALYGCSDELYAARMAEAIQKAEVAGVNCMAFGDLFLEIPFP